MAEYQKSPFRLLLKKTVGEDNTESLISERVSPGCKWTIEHLIMRDRDDSCDYFRVLIGGDGEEYLVCEQADPVEDTPYWFTKPFELIEGDWLIGRFVGTSTSDRLLFYFKGKVTKRIR